MAETEFHAAPERGRESMTAASSTRQPYNTPVLKVFGPVALITGSNRAGSSFDAKFGDRVGKKNQGGNILPAL